MDHIILQGANPTASGATFARPRHFLPTSAPTVTIEWGTQEVDAHRRPWFRVTSTQPLDHVLLTENLREVEAAKHVHDDLLEDLSHQSIYYQTKVRFGGEVRMSDAYRTAMVHAVSYGTVYGARFEEVKLSQPYLDHRKPTELVVRTDAESVITDQGFGYHLRWDLGISNDIVPTKVWVQGVISEQRWQAMELHRYFVGQYNTLDQASRDLYFPDPTSSQEARDRVAESLDILLNKARHELPDILKPESPSDASAEQVTPAELGDSHLREMSVAGMTRQTDPTGSFADVDDDDAENLLTLPAMEELDMSGMIEEVIGRMGSRAGPWNSAMAPSPWTPSDRLEALAVHPPKPRPIGIERALSAAGDERAGRATSQASVTSSGQRKISNSGFAANLQAPSQVAPVPLDPPGSGESGAFIDRSTVFPLKVSADPTDAELGGSARHAGEIPALVEPSHTSVGAGFHTVPRAFVVVEGAASSAGSDWVEVAGSKDGWNPALLSGPHAGGVPRKALQTMTLERLLTNDGSDVGIPGHPVRSTSSTSARAASASRPVTGSSGSNTAAELMTEKAQLLKGSTSETQQTQRTRAWPGTEHTQQKRNQRRAAGDSSTKKPSWRSEGSERLSASDRTEELVPPTVKGKAKTASGIQQWARANTDRHLHKPWRDLSAPPEVLSSEQLTMRDLSQLKARLARGPRIDLASKDATSLRAMGPSSLGRNSRRGPHVGEEEGASDAAAEVLPARLQGDEVQTAASAIDVQGGMTSAKDEVTGA